MNAPHEFFRLPASAEVLEHERRHELVSMPSGTFERWELECSFCGRLLGNPGARMRHEGAYCERRAST